MPLAGVVLDFDGLILDTEGPSFRAWSDAFRRHGCELSLEDWQRGVGTHGGFDPCARLRELGAAALDDEALREDVREASLGGCRAEPLRPGVRDLLAEARRLGLGVAVASSSSSTWVEGWLRGHGIAGFFDAVCGRDHVARVKPAADLFLFAAERLGVPPAECLAFEDSLNGVRAARAAGMRCVAVPNDITRLLPLSDEADAVLATVAEVPLSALARALGLGAPRRAGGPLRVPRFVILGGGDTGARHLRQLLRAVAAGRLTTEEIVVVDRDASCPARADVPPHARVTFEVADWGEWLERRLDGLSSADHLVPHHWAPHLLVEWLQRRLREAGVRAERDGFVPPQGTPFDRPTRAGDRALSYATWPCPPACVEPAVCPHTLGPRDWSLAGELGREGGGFDGRAVFRCLHLLWGVGTIPVAEARESLARLTAAGRAGGGRWLVATASHCHGLATVLELKPA